MTILNGTPQAISAGTYNIQVEITDGSAVILYSTGGLDAVSIDGASYVESNGDNFRLPACNIHAVLTGDAVAEINAVGG
jgi:hypothetical protein